MRFVTLADVAALAGVSSRTVSRVVNRDPNVNVETRRRIEAAIAESGFRPNPAARSLASSRSYLIGVFTINAASSYHSELVRGAGRACRTHGYHLVLQECDCDGSSAVASYEQELRAVRCDGVILSPPISDDGVLLDALDRDGLRYVRLAPAKDVTRSAAIFADDARGVVAMVRHLWEQGHRRFGIVAGTPDHSATAIRRDSFIAEVVGLGGAARDVRVAGVIRNGSLMESGRNAAAMLLSYSERPTAIFAFNDGIAAGVMNYAREIGLTVPDDLAIAGFDDSDAAMLTWPPLTTVRQPIADMGARAVEVLVGPPTTERVDCSVELIVRGSTR